ncbi:hypothetical protein O1R50_04710 [Glycomyces luteolus]|uniref:Uncharacterized protein n=1 Tax=Glycomyces luteolus TaxID=2670330 RepID=A0A9X3PI32_9ACTN|nr:hypothetical protein [Glycomyces luteolus]MDA1358910.1 hypothetical protein [Glycomyces luteolus]
MKLRFSFASVPIAAGIAAAAGFVFTLFDPGDDMDFVELAAATAIIGGIVALIALVCLAIPHSKIDERGFWQFLNNGGMQLVRPIGHGERFVVRERRLFVLRADGEYEQLKLYRWSVSRSTWARLAAAYPLELAEQDESATG